MDPHLSQLVTLEKVRTQGQVASASPGERPQKKPPCQHLDLGLPVSRNVGILMSVV